MTEHVGKFRQKIGGQTDSKNEYREFASTTTKTTQDPLTGFGILNKMDIYLQEANME